MLEFHRLNRIICACVHWDYNERMEGTQLVFLNSNFYQLESLRKKKKKTTNSQHSLQSTSAACNQAQSTCRCLQDLTEAFLTFLYSVSNKVRSWSRSEWNIACAPRTWLILYPIKHTADVHQKHGTARRKAKRRSRSLKGSGWFCLREYARVCELCEVARCF